MATAEYGNSGPTPTLSEVYERALLVHYCHAKNSSGVKARWRTLTRFCDPDTPVTAFRRRQAEDIALAMRCATWKRSTSGAARPYSESSINRVLSLLGKLLSLAHEWEYLPSVPKMPKSRESSTFKRRNLTEEEYVAMLRALCSHPNSRWVAYCDLLRVLWGTGCRMGELVCQWHQVDLTNKALYWEDTKSGYAVGKPMTKDVHEVLTQRRNDWSIQVVPLT